VTLPLIWKGVLVGGLFSFMTSLQEASAVLFLSLGGWETITVGIFNFYIAGSTSEAAALGVVLIVVAAACVVLINRVAGARMGGMFGSPRRLAAMSVVARAGSDPAHSGRRPFVAGVHRRWRRLVPDRWAGLLGRPARVVSGGELC
jgi:hypothetical protein